MKFSGEIAVCATRDAVFAKLQDIHFFASCIEGVCDLTPRDDQCFDAVLETMAERRAAAAAGVQIFEYVPSALHAKVAVVDRRWATVGSTNLDPLSLLLAREANVVSGDEVFARALHDRLDHIVTHDGRALQPQALAARPWPQRALDRLAFMVMRATLFVTGHRY